jgi:cytochrome c peroxidase
MRKSAVLALGLLALTGPVLAKQKKPKPPKPRVLLTKNASGQGGTLIFSKKLDTSGPFFQSLGTNGRSCVTCHDPAAAWSLSPTAISARFEATQGLDPLFRPHDGANSPLADVSTLAARRSAYSMLLRKGVVRIGLPVPADAEFTVEAVDDPYGYASASELSLFRRPLPATNLRFQAHVMWDGRETHAGSSLEADLATQAQNATLGHGQAGAPLSPETLSQIVQFELQNVTAQARDTRAGKLDGAGAKGGAKALAAQEFVPGINDPSTAGFNPNVFTLFDKWTKKNAKQKSVARGQLLFNTRTFKIRDTPGLNDVLQQPLVTATCSTCHSAPNAGAGTLGSLMNIGVGTLILDRTPDEPLYTLRNQVSGETVQTPDPGQALVTGKWADIGKFKVPSLRGLAARAPYFHSGAAADLAQVLDFYDRRYGIGLHPEETEDLIAFLRSL